VRVCIPFSLSCGHGRRQYPSTGRGVCKCWFHQSLSLLSFCVCVCVYVLVVSSPSRPAQLYKYFIQEQSVTPTTPFLLFHRVSYVFRAVANVTCLGAMEFRVRELQTSRFVHTLFYSFFLFFTFVNEWERNTCIKVVCSAVQCTFPQGRLNRLDSSSSFASPLSLGGVLTQKHKFLRNDTVLVFV